MSLSHLYAEEGFLKEEKIDAKEQYRKERRKR